MTESSERLIREIEVELERIPVVLEVAELALKESGIVMSQLYFRREESRAKREEAQAILQSAGLL